MLETDFKKEEIIETGDHSDEEIEMIEGKYGNNQLIVQKQRFFNKNIQNISCLPDLIEEEEKFLEPVPLFISKEKKLVKRNFTHEIIIQDDSKLGDRKTPIIKILPENENKSLNESIESLNLTDAFYKDNHKREYLPANSLRQNSLQDYEINEAIFNVYQENVISRSELNTPLDDSYLNEHNTKFQLRSSSVPVVKIHESDIDERKVNSFEQNPKNIPGSYLNLQTCITNDIESSILIKSIKIR